MKKIITTSALLVLTLGFSKLVLADELTGATTDTPTASSAPIPDDSEKKAQEEKNRQEEAKKAEEEKQHLEAKKAEEERKAQEASKAAEEERKAQEASKAEAERRAQEAKNAEELNRAQNEKRAEEDKKAQLNEQLARSAQAKEEESKRALHAQQPSEVSPTPSDRMTAREKHRMERALHRQQTQAAAAACQETVVTQTKVEHKDSRPPNSFTEKLKAVTNEVRSSETRPSRPTVIIQPAHPVVHPAPVVTIVREPNDAQRFRERELKERELRLRELELRNREMKVRPAPVVTIVRDSNDVQRFRERELKEREMRLRELELRNREQRLSEKEKVMQEREWYQRSLRNRYWQDIATRDAELRYLMWRERQLNTFTWIDQGRICKYVTYYNKGVRVNKAVTITRWRNGVRTTYHPTRYYIYPVTRVVCYFPRRISVTTIVH